MLSEGRSLLLHVNLFSTVLGGLVVWGGHVFVWLMSVAWSSSETGGWGIVGEAPVLRSVPAPVENVFSKLHVCCLFG